MTTRRSARLSVQVSNAVTVSGISAEISVRKRPRTSSIPAPDSTDLTAESSVLFGGDSPLSDFSEGAPPLISTGTPTKRAKPKKRKVDKSFSPLPEDYTARLASDWKIGAHVSAAGGIEMAIPNAAAIGANAFALFLKSQRKWAAPPYQQESISRFKSWLTRFGYMPSQVLPHGSYLVNLGNPDAQKREKSYGCFLDELQRCEQLGLTLYNFHPGSTVGQATHDESIALIAQCLNKAHKATNSVITVIENMAGSGNILCSNFSEIAHIIAQVEDKNRVGVCLDTCHMFAAGYDIRTKPDYDRIMADFDKIVGLSYLKDRHANIGLAELGLTAFHYIVTDPRLKGIPLILETPIFESPSIWKQEIEVLNELSQLKLCDDDGQQVDGIDEKMSELTGRVKAAADVAAKEDGKSKKRKAKKKAKVSAEEGEDGDVEDDVSS